MSRRPSKRTTEELVHCSAPKLAAIMGVSLTSVHTWRNLPTAPKCNADGEYPIRDWCEWYLTYRSNKEVRLRICQALARGLSLTLSGEPSASVVPDGPVSPVVAQVQDFKSRSEELKLLTQEAEYQLKYGDAVRIRHISPIIVQFVQKLREQLEAVERKTGHSVIRGVEIAVDDLMRELNSSTGGGRDDHAQ